MKIYFHYPLTQTEQKIYPFVYKCLNKIKNVAEADTDLTTGGNF